VVLLAAGRGQRFREAAHDPQADKLLQALPDGQPLVLHAARTLRMALPASPAIAVVRPDAADAPWADALRQAGWAVLTHPDVAAGMGCSLALAVRATLPGGSQASAPAGLQTGEQAGAQAAVQTGGQAGAPATGWLVALGDMPFIHPASIAAVAQALAAGPQAIAAPVHAGRRGHPVGFGAAHGPALAALQGDEGARALLQRHAHALQLVPVDDPGVLRDVDTPADLGR
jgi:molybdenum cofactor cytidylyltransferase